MCERLCPGIVYALVWRLSFFYHQYFDQGSREWLIVGEFFCAPVRPHSGSHVRWNCNVEGCCGWRVVEKNAGGLKRAPMGTRGPLLGLACRLCSAKFFRLVNVEEV
ncbi:unnamed protein product [Ostreobium quekettii]|uniref:Uncharacterized protein n=1 Tax=Ostreobium quekettii TaxID=121088 RepID=A0A8S1JF24_9CHLO|nr:unnamed protein product [Ostreobium quekettii]